MSLQFGQRTRTAVRHPLALLLWGALVGAIAWSGYAALLPVSLCFLAFLPLANSWLGRFSLGMGYFSAASWTVLPGAAIFFGHEFNPVGISMVWLGVAALLSAPWALLCRPAWTAWAVPLCLVAEAVPPLTAFAIANPIVSAGMMFPKLSWAGLILFFILVGIISVRPTIGLTIATLLTLATLRIKPPAPPAGWTAINTALGGQGLDTPDPIKDFTTAQYIQRTALRSKAKVIIFPESVVYRWNSATEAFWHRTLGQLANEHRTLIVGATVAFAGNTTGYRNIAVVRGADNDLYDQRVPMPVSMWKPIDSSGVPMNFLGRSTITIGGRKTALLICYEQLLVWPVVRSAADKPELFIGIANDYWAVHTHFPKIQTSSLTSWGRLFNLPVLSAVNQ